MHTLLWGILNESIKFRRTDFVLENKFLNCIFSQIFLFAHYIQVGNCIKERKVNICYTMMPFARRYRRNAEFCNPVSKTIKDM